MGAAIGDRRRGIRGQRGAIQRLQEKMVEAEMFEPVGCHAGLRVDQLQLVAPGQPERSARTWGLTQIQSMPAGAGSVPLVSTAMEKPCACRAATRAASTWSSGSPPVSTTNRQRNASPQCRGDGLGQRGRVGEAATAGTVGADKIGVADATRRVGTIGFAAAPQIAAGEAAEHRRPAGVAALALQGVEDFFNGVAHGGIDRGPSGALEKSTEYPYLAARGQISAACG